MLIISIIFPVELRRSAKMEKLHLFVLLCLLSGVFILYSVEKTLNSNSLDLAKYGKEFEMSSGQLQVQLDNKTDRILQLLFKKDRFKLKENIETHVTSSVTKPGDVTSSVTKRDDVTSPIRVLLQTNHRSGSSFVGEIFKKNPKSFYSFEPLYLTTLNVTTDPQQVLALRDVLLDCDFRAFRNAEKKYGLRRYLRNSWMLRSFGSSRPENIERKCRMNADRAIKTIRLPYLHDSVPVIAGSGGVVFYLVRDPRGVYSSNLKLGFTDVALQEVSDNCAQHLVNIRYLRSLNSNDDTLALKNRVRILRYEDVAQWPLKMADRMYGFFGQTIPPKVVQAVKVMTSLDGKNPYGVTRISNKIWSAWRQHLSFTQVLEVQEVCSEAMKELGYRLLDNDTLTNFNFSFMTSPASDLPLL